MRFQPETLTVAPGDSVVWVNKDLVPHTVTSEAGGFDSQIIQAEKSWRFTARKKGDFAYICTLHPTMKAILQVKYLSATRIWPSGRPLTLSFACIPISDGCCDQRLDAGPRCRDYSRTDGNVCSRVAGRSGAMDVERQKWHRHGRQP